MIDRAPTSVMLRKAGSPSKVLFAKVKRKASVRRWYVRILFSVLAMLSALKLYPVESGFFYRGKKKNGRSKRCVYERRPGGAVFCFRELASQGVTGCESKNVICS